MLFDLNLHRWTLPSVRLDFLTALGLDQISQLKIDNQKNVSVDEISDYTQKNSYENKRDSEN